MAALVGVVALIASSGSSTHRVQFIVPQATGLIGGNDIRMAGVRVGQVGSVTVTPDYRAKVTLDINDSVWPLPVNTVFRLRTGGTIHYTDRYVEIDRGNSPKTIAAGATLPASHFVNAIEYDTVFNAFSQRTRQDFGSLLSHGGLVAPGVERTLPGALVNGPAAAAASQVLLGQLGDDPRALDTLMRSSAAVAGAVARSNPGFGQLVSSTGSTFASVASAAQQLDSTLSQAPSTLIDARATAAQADTTLTLARDLTARLAGGVDRLRAIAPPLAHLLGTVVNVAPNLRATLATLHGAAPQLDGLLNRARTPLMGRVQSIGNQATTQLQCIRPYSPEIGGLSVDWASLWGSAADAQGKVFRAQVGVVPFPNEMTATSGQIAKLMPPGAFQIAFPRPPGELVRQSWYQPQCGITASAVNPAADPEGIGYTDTGKSLITFTTPPAKVGG
ncbi:MAG: MlaD family protein [Solirubrobacteraceae bacterium]